MVARFQSDPSELLPWATAREREAIEALRTHKMNTVAAAESLGITFAVLHQRLRTCRRRALRTSGVPSLPGMFPKQVTTDGEGVVTSVQHRLEEGAPPELPPTLALKGVSQLLDGEGREILRWNKLSQSEQDRWEAFSTAVRELAAAVPAAPVVRTPVAGDAELCTILPWGDPHLGMLAWSTETGDSWDLRIAEEVTAQVMADLIDRTPRSDVFVLSDLGDLFHAEDDRQVTPTAGHKLDVDGRTGKVCRVACRVFKSAIDLALARHGRVSVRLLRGNHDPHKAVALGLWLEAVYANNPRVTIEPYDNPYQFWRWGECAFMWHHGDGSKPQQMPGVFAVADEWQGASHRFVHTGHIHSQNLWDFPGCTVESFRTIAPADYWAHWKGYRSQRTLDAITYDKTHGEVSRVRQGIRRRS